MGKTNIDILDVMIVLAKRKKFIVIVTFLVTTAVIIYSLLATKYWKSSVSFLTISQTETPAMISQSLLGGMGASFLGMEGGGDALNHINIIKSRSFSEQIIREFGLIDYFEVEDPDSLVVMELAVKLLHEKMLRVSLDGETGMITITVETKDRYLSSDIANAYFNKLEQYFLANKMSKGREGRLFLEQRVEEFEKSFTELNNKIEQLQKESKIVDIDAQKEQIVTLYANIVAQKTEAEIELEYTKRFAGENSPVVKGLAEKVAVFNEAITEMESGSSPMRPRYMVNIDDIPDINSRFLQLNLNIEIQRKVIEYLYPQYELAKLEEVKDLPTFEIYDAPQIAGIRSKPKRAITVIVSTVAAFIFSCILALILESFQGENREKILAIKAALFRKRKQS